MRAGSKLLAAGALAASVVASPVLADTYRNAEYGFSVDVLDGAPTCRAEPPQHDTGLDIFLDDGPDGCKALLSRPFVGVLAVYNAMFEPSPEEGLRCSPDDGVLVAAPPGLQIGKRPSATCMLERSDGWIELRVVAQSSKSFDAGTLLEATAPLINYTVMLRTRPERLAVDLAQLRGILDTVRVFEPE